MKGAALVVLLLLGLAAPAQATCSYTLWSMFLVGREYKYQSLMGNLSKEACVAEIKARVPYEKKWGILRYYAPDPKSHDRIGCFPSPDYDPRDE